MGWQDALRIANTLRFRNALKNCACENDKTYTDQFGMFYKDLIENKIVLQIYDFWIFNHADHFVNNKNTELVSSLNRFNFKECTKNKILEFYKSKTMNVVNLHGGRKTRKKRSRSKKKILHQKTNRHK